MSDFQEVRKLYIFPIFWNWLGHFCLTLFENELLMVAKFSMLDLARYRNGSIGICSGGSARSGRRSRQSRRRLRCPRSARPALPLSGPATTADSGYGCIFVAGLDRPAAEIFQSGGCWSSVPESVGATAAATTVQRRDDGLQLPRPALPPSRVSGGFGRGFLPDVLQLPEGRCCSSFRR